ncbi:DUF6518 family protein [Streptomyces globisporus]|uniref:DUF6518 family protein n=1 Tax=Streptomyces globisporus TaxID=1908 RepID=UPI00367D9169
MAATGSIVSPRLRLKNAPGAAVLCLGAGLVGGILTNLAQGWLPGAWNNVANSGAVWTMFAFAAGASLAHRTDGHRLPAAAGVLAEIGLVVGYYGYAEFGRDGVGSLTFPLLWLAMACVAGPLFGVVGAWSRRGTRPWLRYVALGALGGLFGSEGLHYWLGLEYLPQAVVCGALACGLPLLLGRTGKERGLSLAVAIPASFATYQILYGLLGAVSG